MTLVYRGALWIGVFLGVTIGPLVFAVIGVSGPGRGFATEFSAALGFIGLSLIGLEFAIVARFRAVTEPFGSDALVQFHRAIGLVGLGLVGVHVAISAPWDLVIRPFDPDTPARVRWALLAVLALLALIGSSVWRTRLRLSYESWQMLHAVLAVTVIGSSLMHALLVDYYLSTTWKRLLWTAMAAAFVIVLVWVRIAKPLLMWSKPWTVERVTAERGQTTTLTLRSDGHDGFDFLPGQYAWFAIGRSPFALTKHPFSFSSSSEADGVVEVSIKALGDFTSTVGNLDVGTKVFIDGPHGVFSPDLFEGPGFGLIAGGIGITPTMSILRTLADRDDSRPIVAFVASSTWEDVTFREELEMHAQRPSVTLVHTLSNPPEGWAGETGRINGEMLRRHLPERCQRWQFFICGPNPMMDAMEVALLSLGVPDSRIHTERFSWV